MIALPNPGNLMFKILKENVMVSDNLANLLLRKVERFPGDMTDTLKVASLLGYVFDEVMLAKVTSNPSDKNPRSNSTNVGNSKLAMTDTSSQSVVVKSLAEAIKEGFLEKMRVGHQFTHNKLQSAFRSLIGKSEEDQLYLRMGEVYLMHSNENSSRMLYKASMHLNRASDFLYSHQQQAKLARINMHAAKYCIGASAFDRAAVMLRKGLDILGPELRWCGDYFSLTFEMMETLARTQLIVGDLEACMATTTEALSHGETVEKNLNLLLIDVEVRMAANEIDATIVAANRTLSALWSQNAPKGKVATCFGKAWESEVYVAKQDKRRHSDAPIHAR